MSPTVTISGLQNISGSLSNNDLIEVSKNIGSGSYTSSNATMAQVANFISTTFPIIQAGSVSLVNQGYYNNVIIWTPIVFAKPMPNTNYAINLGYNKAALIDVFWTGKTVNGFSSSFSSAFTGELDWVVIGFTQ